MSLMSELCVIVIVHSPQVLRRKSRAEPIPLFRGTLRLDCFPNGSGAMLSSKQIFQTGSSVRPTFVGHKVNWGEAGPGQGTPLSSLAAARRENGAQRLFIVAGPWLSTGPGEMRATRVTHWPGIIKQRHGRRTLPRPTNFQWKQNTQNSCFEMQTSIMYIEWVITISITGWQTRASRRPAW